MTLDPSSAPKSVTATVALSCSDWEIKATMTVPAGPTCLEDMLPLAQTVADGVVNAAVNSVTADGSKISCKKGCGACCRQLVPIAEVEAHGIAHLVNALPEPRRSEIRARFTEARRRLEESGQLDKLLRRDSWSEGEGRSVGLEYFAQGIACPFLDDESCSIYTQRPTSCREYLVTSPAEHCARPSAEHVKMVRMPLKVWTALARFDEVPAGATYVRWVPLVLAPEWAEAHAGEPLLRPGPEWLQQLFENLKTNANLKQAADARNSSDQL